MFANSDLLRSISTAALLQRKVARFITERPWR